MKGTDRHRKIGYVYVISMLGVNVAAFMIYRLFDSFGMFHWMAVVSTLTLLVGMTPILRRKGKGYVVYHSSFMYRSVMGLYGAFISKTLVRLPAVVILEGVPKELFYFHRSGDYLDHGNWGLGGSSKQEVLGVIICRIS